MKKLLISVLAALLIVPSLAMASSFNDVADDHPNFTAIEFLKAFNIVNGYDDGTFRPDNKVNRAEALKMILLSGGVDIDAVLAEETIDEDVDLVFEDVADDAWFSGIVKAAVREKIISGYDDGTFRPDKPVILAEALKMAFQAYDLDELPTEFEAPYEDVSVDLWFAPFASFTKSKNITLPKDDGFLHAGREVTRAELAELLYRFRYTANRDLEPVPIDLGWAAHKNADLAFQALIPNDWEVVVNPRSVLFWKKDPAFTNVHHELLFPNAASISFTPYENKEGFSKEDFFEQLKLSSTYAYDKVESLEMEIADFDTLKIDETATNASTYILDTQDGRFLVVFTNHGDGANAEYLAKSIEAVLDSIASYTKAPINMEELKAKIFAAVLIEAGAEVLLEDLDDELLIEADTLGVGTGPVDYYYSEQIDLTLKVERNTSTLLDTREGKTSAF